MRYSMIVAILFLAATTALYGCGSLAAGCVPPSPDTPSYDSAWGRYDACVEDYKQEKRRREDDKRAQE